jgi:hypothetical protein
MTPENNKGRNNRAESPNGACSCLRLYLVLVLICYRHKHIVADLKRGGHYEGRPESKDRLGGGTHRQQDDHIILNTTRTA